jgi:quercetin dioxygenase-like cupin family protein
MPVKAGVIRAGARTTRRGAAETFTGVVFQDPVITAESPSRLGGSVVTFTPGARTAWHSHPVGQSCSVCPASAASASRARSRKC